MTLGPCLMLDPATHDLVIENGALVIGVSVAQAIKCNLLFVRGEWFLDRTRGVPYFEQVFVKPVNLAHLRSLFSRTIEDTPGVDKVVKLDLDYEETTRMLSINFTASTDEGEISDSVEFEIGG